MKHIFLVIILFLSACSNNKANLNTWTKPQAKLMTLNEIAVMPISSNNGVSISSDQLQAISKKLKSELNLKTSISVKECDSVVDEGRTMLEKAASYASSCGTQGTLYGLVTKYGNSEAAFNLWLYSGKHRAVVWTTIFENSQPVLTDNIFGSGGQGLKYKDSEKVLYQGLSDAAKNLEKSRMN